MSAYVIWWIVAFALLAAELASGTFYLLVYGLAAAAAGIAAWLGLGPVAQLVIAAAIGMAGTVALRKWRRAESSGADVQDLDIGQSVVLESWQDGRGRVRYRGTVWDAEAAGADIDPARPLFIRAMRGSVLIIGN